MSQQKKITDLRIAPFPFEKTREKGHLKADLSDIEKAVKAFCQQQQREAPAYIDVRGGVSYWFKEMNVLWNGEPVYAEMADRQEDPWVIEWDTF